MQVDKPFGWYKEVDQLVSEFASPVVEDPTVGEYVSSVLIPSIFHYFDAAGPYLVVVVVAEVAWEKVRVDLMHAEWELAYAFVVVGDDDDVLDVIDREVIDHYHKIQFAGLNHAGIVFVVVAVGSDDFVMLHAPLDDIELMLVAVAVEIESGIDASAVLFDPKTECAYEKEESDYKDWKLNSAAAAVFDDTQEESEI